VFDGPNILLKLHVHRFNILRDIAIFVFGPFGLKLPVHAHFGKFFWGDMTVFPLELGTGARVQKLEWIWLPGGRKSFKIGSRFDTIPARDRHPASQPAIFHSKYRAI